MASHSGSRPDHVYGSDQIRRRGTKNPEPLKNNNTNPCLSDSRFRSPGCVQSSSLRSLFECMYVPYLFLCHPVEYSTKASMGLCLNQAILSSCTVLSRSIRYINFVAIIPIGERGCDDVSKIQNQAGVRTLLCKAEIQESFVVFI